MIKNKEKIIDEKTEKIYKKIQEYVNEMDSLSDTSDFTIDKIEKMWNELGEYTEKIYKEINNEIIRQIDEKRLKKKKKKSIC
jgi:uncharacterized FlaG/YvyC family protein